MASAVMAVSTAGETLILNFQFFSLSKDLAMTSSLLTAADGDPHIGVSGKC